MPIQQGFRSMYSNGRLRHPLADMWMSWMSCIDYLSRRFKVQAHQKARDKRTASATTV
jgi:hypothetical protein